MGIYAPLPRTCSKCKKNGNTENTHARILFKLDGGMVIHLSKWKQYCDPCYEVVKNKIESHMKGLELD